MRRAYLAEVRFAHEDRMRGGDATPNTNSEEFLRGAEPVILSVNTLVILSADTLVILSAGTLVILSADTLVILSANTLVILGANTLVILRRSRRIWPPNRRSLAFAAQIPHATSFRSEPALSLAEGMANTAHESPTIRTLTM